LGKRISDRRASVEAFRVKIEGVCRRIGDDTLIKDYLERRFPVQAKMIFGGGNLGEDEAIEMWVSGDAPGDLSGSGFERSIEQLLLADIWTLTNSERSHLYQHWLDSSLAELSQRFQDLMDMHSSEKQRLTSLFHESDAQILDRSDVVGVTTTGLANNSELLRGLRAKVLICEEAGEVLESHVLTALLPSIQHAVLIGDHLQLRPRISNLKLSMEYDRRNGFQYNLDESLFERLANSRFGDWNTDGERQGERGSRFPVASLDHQRRMHPTIATLVRETLYPHLQDHPNTTCYPEIPGMKRRLFWLDHRNMEDANDPEEPMQSKTNMWEANMVTALVRHLCRQGKYKPGEIAVLTPYVGQLRVLRDMLADVAELIIAERDLEDLDISDAEVDVGEGDNPKREQRPQERQRRQQTVEKGKLLDELKMATVDNFQVRGIPGRTNFLDTYPLLHSSG
jgi:hypothetical protein